MIRPITEWYKGKWREFNHIEEGHSHKGEPYVNYKCQKQTWKNNIWQKKWNYLESYNKEEVPKISIQCRSENDFRRD